MCSPQNYSLLWHKLSREKYTLSMYKYTHIQIHIYMHIFLHVCSCVVCMYVWCVYLCVCVGEWAIWLSTEAKYRKSTSLCTYLWNPVSSYSSHWRKIQQIKIETDLEKRMHRSWSESVNWLLNEQLQKMYGHVSQKLFRNETPVSGYLLFIYSRWLF